MAILDFLFGRTKRTPTTTTVQQSSKLPEEIAPFVKEVLGEAQDLFQQRKAEGFKEFPGETIAPRTAEELAAMEGLRGLVGTQEPYRAEAEEVIRATPTQFTAEDAQRLMSPYQRAVTDIEKREAQRTFERDVQPALEARAIQAGGMSGLGTRAALQAAEAQRQQSQLLADIEAKGQQRAFEQAYRQFGDEVALQRQRAGDIQQQGAQRFNIGLAERGLQQQLGQEDRAEAQALLNEQFAEFLEREQFPESTLAQYSSFIYGNPFLRTPDTTRTTTGMLEPTTSMGQGLLNLGLTGLNIYGRGYVPGQGFSLGQFGKSFQRKGGGLVSLPVVNRRGAGAVDPRLTRLTQPQPVQPAETDTLRGLRSYTDEILRRGGLNVRGESVEDMAKRLGRRTAGLRGLRKTREAQGAQAIQEARAREKGFQDKLRESQMAQFEDSDMLSQPIAEAVKAISAPGMETKGFINQLAAGLSALSAEQAKMSKDEKREVARIEKELISAEALSEIQLAEDQKNLNNQLLAADEKILAAENDQAKQIANQEKELLKENLAIANTASTIYKRFKDIDADAYKKITDAAEAGRLKGADIKLIDESVRKSFGFTTDREGNTIRIGTNEILSEESPVFAQIDKTIAYLTRIFEEAGQDHLAAKEEQARLTPLRQKAIDPPRDTDGSIDASQIKVGQIYNTPGGGLAEAFKDAQGKIKLREII